MKDKDEGFSEVGIREHDVEMLIDLFKATAQVIEDCLNIVNSDVKVMPDVVQLTFNNLYVKLAELQSYADGQRMSSHFLKKVQRWANNRSKEYAKLGEK
jgi:hypothetical protein